MNLNFSRLLLKAATASLFFHLGFAHADPGLKLKLNTNDMFTRTVKTVNGAGPVTGRFVQDFTESTGTKFSFSNSTTSNKTLTSAVRANASVSAVVEGVTGGLDAGFEETTTLYNSTVNSITKELDNTSTKARHYELENGMEGYVAVVTDAVGGFSNSYYTQDKTIRPFKRPVSIAVTVDYTPIFKNFLGLIKNMRRNARDNGSAWDHLYNVVNSADQSANNPFMVYCNSMAGFSDGMDSGSWEILSGAASRARNMYNQKRPKEAMLEFLEGYYLIRNPSKNRSEWAGLAAAAEAVIKDVRNM